MQTQHASLEAVQTQQEPALITLGEAAKLANVGVEQTAQLILRVGHLEPAEEGPR
jgi:hypothetical protein